MDDSDYTGARTLATLSAEESPHIAVSALGKQKKTQLQGAGGLGMTETNRREAKG